MHTTAVFAVVLLAQCIDTTNCRPPIPIHQLREMYLSGLLSAQPGCSNGKCTPAQHAGNLASQYTGSQFSPRMDFQGCMSSRQQQMQAKYYRAEQHRQTVKNQREKTRSLIPQKVWTEEELAEAKFKLAHQLYLNGKTESSAKWLEKIEEDYPDTLTANRARFVLTRMNPELNRIAYVATR